MIFIFYKMIWRARALLRSCIHNTRLMIISWRSMIFKRVKTDRPVLVRKIMIKMFVNEELSSKNLFFCEFMIIFCFFNIDILSKRLSSNAYYEYSFVIKLSLSISFYKK